MTVVAPEVPTQVASPRRSPWSTALFGVFAADLVAGAVLVPLARHVLEVSDSVSGFYSSGGLAGLIFVVPGLAGLVMTAQIRRGGRHVAGAVLGVVVALCLSALVAAFGASSVAPVVPYPDDRVGLGGWFLLMVLAGYAAAIVLVTCVAPLRLFGPMIGERRR